MEPPKWRIGLFWAKNVPKRDILALFEGVKKGVFRQKCPKRTFFLLRKKGGFYPPFAGIFDLRFYGGIGGLSSPGVEPSGLSEDCEGIGETSFRRTTCSFLGWWRSPKISPLGRNFWRASIHGAPFEKWSDYV